MQEHVAYQTCYFTAHTVLILSSRAPLSCTSSDRGCCLQVHSFVRMYMGIIIFKYPKHSTHLSTAFHFRAVQRQRDFSVLGEIRQAPEGERSRSQQSSACKVSHSTSLQGPELPSAVHEIFLKLFRTDSGVWSSSSANLPPLPLQRRQVRVDLSSFIHTKCNCPVLHATHSSQLPLPYPLSCHPRLLRQQKLHHAATHTSISD